MFNMTMIYNNSPCHLVTLSPLNRGWPLLDRANAIQIELGASVECVDAVLLLVYIGQLGVAVTEH